MKQIFNKLQLNKIPFVSTWIIILIGVFIIFGPQELKTDVLSTLKCPDEYETSEERVAAFERFSDYYYEKYPDGTMDDFLEARRQFWTDKNCKEALDRYDDYMAGHINSETLEIVDEVINDPLNEPQKAIPHTNEELCKEGAFTAPLEEEIAFDKEVKSYGFVKYLRRTLDDFFENQYENFENSTDCVHPGLSEGRHCTDSAYFDFGYTLSRAVNLIGIDYLKSKFIVLQTDGAPGGGYSIILMFKERPDKVFYAWVYPYLGSGYDLRGFFEHELKKGEPTIRETQKMFINQLCSESLGI